ncbi:MAG: hypothetical protein CMJ52_04075 [Planctomycetaceae bacterium]|nr:hypothetical protein [Planctomycetaceae bacterium]
MRASQGRGDDDFSCRSHHDAPWTAGAAPRQAARRELAKPSLGAAEGEIPSRVVDVRRAEGRSTREIGTPMIPC